jgi:hypothetical protein
MSGVVLIGFMGEEFSGVPVCPYFKARRVACHQARHKKHGVGEANQILRLAAHALSVKEKGP